MGISFSTDKKQEELINQIQDIISSIKDKINDNNIALSKINNKNSLIEKRLTDLQNQNKTDITNLKKNTFLNNNKITEIIQNSQILENKFNEIESTFITLNNQEQVERKQDVTEIYEKILEIKENVGKELKTIVNQLNAISSNIEKKNELERKKFKQEFIEMKDDISSQYTKIIENVFKVNDEDLANSLQSVMEEEGNNGWLPDDIERQLIRSAVIVVYDLLKKSRQIN
jgi:prophage DNA circulation protein